MRPNIGPAAAGPVATALSSMVSRIVWEFVEGFLESIGADYVHRSVKITVKFWSPISDYMRS